MQGDFVHQALGPDPAVALASALINANLAAGAMVLGLAAVRGPARRLLGPEAAYNLWALPPLVTTGFTIERHAATAQAGAGIANGLPHLDLLSTIWAFGAVAVAVAFVVAQARFMATVRAGRAGPAVVGLISPRIVMPANDGRYTTDERGLIRAHEREHVARKDPRGAAWAALFQCVCWFNPFIHLAAYLLRLDQELACDAAVVRNRPTARGLYARTLLKTQLAARPLPFGCYWPARGAHPLEVRVEALKRRPGKRAPHSPAAGDTIVFAAGDAIRP